MRSTASMHLREGGGGGEGGGELAYKDLYRDKR